MENKEKEKWVKYAHVIASKNKSKIIKSLKTSPSTPSKIAKKLEMNASIVSRLLRDLSNENIIKCINPNERKGKLYYLTDIGNWISERL